MVAALLGFLGGFAFAPTTFFLPCIMWLRIKKPKRFSLVWCINYVSSFLSFSDHPLSRTSTCFGAAKRAKCAKRANCAKCAKCAKWGFPYNVSMLSGVDILIACNIMQRNMIYLSNQEKPKPKPKTYQQQNHSCCATRVQSSISNISKMSALSHKNRLMYSRLQLLIGLGVLLMILACIGGGNKLISDLASNGLYQWWRRGHCPQIVYWIEIVSVEDVVSRFRNRICLHG